VIVLAAAAPAANNVVTGVLAFLVVAAMAIALVFLLRSMNKQLRKVAPGPKWREQTRNGGPGATAGGDTAPGQGASTKP
jgi:hypothetical protein